MTCISETKQDNTKNRSTDPTEGMMGKSGNPAKAAEERKISQIGDYKKRMGGIIELPSGFFVKVKNPGGLRAFMDSGSIPNSLMPIIQESLNRGKKPDPK